MDELVHHCLTELSFDGDLGCNVSRLRDFIVGFYTHHSASHPQTIDDAFYAFVWSIILQQPTVRVGSLPPGEATEVYIAPQSSAKRKAKAKGEFAVEEAAPALNIIADAKSRPLDDLKARYGDTLRIAVDPETTFAAITGSHIRPPKLSPIVYTALQFVTRGREDGISVLELGQKSKYDQKTCFYLVKQLVDLDLVVKVRRGGVGTNFCVHKYFFERNSLWKEIREEETQAEVHQRQSIETLPQSTEDMSFSSLHFDPIDARHLSSLPLVRARIVKLLKASKNNMHAANNLLLVIGFLNPTKTDRRFFQSRIRELVQQGVIEKVIVPSNNNKDVNATTRCLRLVTVDNQRDDDGMIPQPTEADDRDEKESGNEAATESGMLKFNITIHKQVMDLLEDSGTKGMTLNELSTALCQFDKRTIELLLARAEKLPPPPHLSDLGTTGLMETFGRERRHRYYTVGSYRALIKQEHLDQSSTAFDDVELANVGGFTCVESPFFYKDKKELFEYQDEYKSNETAKGAAKSKKTYKNPTLPDGSIKQGRPRKPKVKTAVDTRKKSDIGNVTKRKRMEDDDAVDQQRCLSSGIGDTHANLYRASVKKRRVNSLQDPSSPLDNRLTSSPQLSETDQNRENGVLDSVSGTRKRRRREGVGSDSESASQQRNAQREGHLAATELVGFTRTEQRTGKRARLHGPNSETYRSTLPGDHSHSGSSSPLSDVPDSPRFPMTTSFTFNDNFETIGSNPLATNHQSLPTGGHLGAHNVTSQTNNAVNRTVGQVNTGQKAKVNVSSLRRENELCRVIESFGGIVNANAKGFYDAHLTLIEVMAQTGEATSTPIGTRLDKRTANMTFDNMERRGRVKILKTSVVTPTGVIKPACVVYFPDLEEGKLGNFLANLSHHRPVAQPAMIRKIDQRMEYGASTRLPHSALPLQLLQVEQPGGDSKERRSKNAARADQLFSYDDAIIREVLLTERTTSAQLNGFIVGKAVRARYFHISAIDLFEADVLSPHIVSREHRIISISYFFDELPLSAHCALVSSSEHDDELTRLLATDEGRRMPLHSIPSSLHVMLQLGQARSRARVLELLVFLHALDLVKPLQVSTSGAPWTTCPPNGQHPTAFDVGPMEGWSASAPMTAPMYWCFNSIAPLHLWVLSETSPPFWRNVNVISHDDVEAYWKDLRLACTDRVMAETTAHDDSRSLRTSLPLARSLRRSASWNSDYLLTWHQKQFLRRYVDVSTGNTPLQAEDGMESILQKICWVISAPRPVVSQFFVLAHTKATFELEKARRKAIRGSKGKHTVETKTLLAKKAAEAKLQREQVWEGLINRVHPEPLKGSTSIRVRRIHSRFLQSGSGKDVKQWEEEITQAIREITMAAPKILKHTKKCTTSKPVPRGPPPPIVPNQPEKSIEDLIAQQGPRLTSKPTPKKRKGRVKETGEQVDAEVKPKSHLRRHRFQWTRDYEELARDASTIIKARCRNGPRLDLGAIEQVFPAVPRNSVRQRLAHIRSCPGNEAYLKRLEDSWYDLWIQHRGTTLLPDDDPQSASNFDLIKHIEFMRKHIDKNALRVGFAQREATFKLPISFDLLFRDWDVVENVPVAPFWDFLWNVVVEEGREKSLLRQAFTTDPEEMTCRKDTRSDAVHVAESALKLVMGAPNESYRHDVASHLLHSLGDDVVGDATSNLLRRGVMSKCVRDPNQSTHKRSIKVSEVNQNALGGSIPTDTFQDAAALEDISEQDETWRHWPPLATDGDIASLLQMVSDRRVDFSIDTLQPQAARLLLDWNSKKADDDQIETAINVRFHDIAGAVQSGSVFVPPDPPDIEYDFSHGTSASGQLASCRKQSKGLIDCVACLDAQFSVFLDAAPQEERELSSLLLGHVNKAGCTGITKDQLLVDLDTSEDRVLNLVHDMADTSPSLVFWTGYSFPVLVSAKYIQPWSVIISEDPRTRIFPRRWLGIDGEKVPEFWAAALKAVIGVLVFRPGIRQLEVCWRLRSVYDRQEVIDLLVSLQAIGLATPRFGTRLLSPDRELSIQLRELDEKKVFWFIGDAKHWYQV